MWVLRRELFAREEWIEMLRNQVLRPCADASLRTGLLILSWALYLLRSVLRYTIVIAFASLVS